jgi:hypothetical protein
LKFDSEKENEKKESKQKREVNREDCVVYGTVFIKNWGKSGRELIESNFLNNVKQCKKILITDQCRELNLLISLTLAGAMAVSSDETTIETTSPNIIATRPKPPGVMEYRTSISPQS